MSKSVPKSAAGFTLLEMLVVLALLSLLMAALTSTIYLGIIARGRVTAVRLDQQDYLSFRRLLIEKLSDAYPQWLVDGQSGHVDFSGTSTSVSFLAPALDEQGPGYAKYQISLTRDDDKATILVQTNYDELETAPTLAADFGVGLSSLSISYFGIARDGKMPIWQNRWIMRATLPKLIAIAVRFSQGDRQSWPVILIRPDIDGDITCEIASNGTGCLGR